MSGEHLLIFMHIPKTAGTTVASHIKANLQPAEWLSLYGIRRTREDITRQITGLAPESRNRIRFVFGHQAWFGIHELFDRQPRYITVLREPTSRVVSHYWHLARNSRSVYYPGIKRGEITLRSWLAGESNPHTINQMTRNLSRTEVGRIPGVDDASPVDGTVLQRAMQNLTQFWFVGLTAAIDLDLPNMLEQSGLQPLGQSERLGEKLSRQERLEIDQELLGVSWQSNWADQQLFSFATMLHEKQRRDLVNGEPT